MAKISPEEKQRVAADWFKGLLALILVLGLLIAGYFIFQNSKINNIQKNNTSPTSKPFT